MAIDDNTSYELTGYQVKDLAQKIRAKADSASLASVATSGLYSDLTGAPTIPTVYNGTLTIQQNGTTLGTFSANQSTNETINITGGGGAAYTAGNGISIDANNEISVDTTVVAEVSDLPTDFTGATSSAAGTHGLVPAPAAGDEGKALHGDGTWKDTTAKLVEMSYGESNAWAKFIAAYNAGSIVYCRASSNSDPGTGTQGRKAFMAYVNNATTPTEVEFQYVRSVNSKTDSQQGDQVFIYKLTNASGGTWTVTTRNMSAKINVSGPITKTFTTGSNATVTIGANAMTGATSGAAGTAGIVPAPAAGSQDKFLRGDGTWAAAGGGGRTTLYTDHSLGIYSVGDTIAVYKDKALTQPITTLAELGSIFDSSVVVLEDNSKESWLFFGWYDDDAYNWSGPGFFYIRGWSGEQYTLCWDRYDGNVLKLHSISPYQNTNSYSTSEVNTGATWVDGKPIYKKTVHFASVAAGDVNTAHGISNLSLVIKHEAFFISSGSYVTVPSLTSTSGGNYFAIWNITSTNVHTFSSIQFQDLYVTLWYTKTTD